jgi:hypothetical protein
MCTIDRSWQRLAKPELLGSIDVTTLVGLRDRALIGIKAYGFARVTAVVSMCVEDYHSAGKRSVCLEIRCHHKLILTPISRRPRSLRGRSPRLPFGSLHTGGVAGSIPASPTILLLTYQSLSGDVADARATVVPPR